MVEVEKKVDRLNLTKENGKKVERLQNQVNEKLNGMIKVTKTDLVNCLLEMHPDELTNEEIKSLGQKCFDEVRWLNSAMERLKAAKKRSESLSMNDLLEERNSVLNQANTIQRGRPKKAKTDEAKSYEVRHEKEEAPI